MLAAWWTFDDGAGTTALDSSANANNGALNNFPGTIQDGCPAAEAWR